MFKLRKHQQDALNNILKTDSDKGRIIIPTGGGKTAVEAFALREFINEDARDVHLVLAPRIALVNQLIKEYRNMIGQNYIAVAFHSGRHEPDYTKVRWAETATTNKEVVIEENARAKRMGKDLVIFSTYASFEKLLSFKFDTLIADESQYCVTEGYFEGIQKIDATKKLFFTATERHTLSDNGRGLNNTSVFGEVLYQVAPKTLIDKGYIVPPRLHLMYADADDSKYTTIDEAITIGKKQSALTNNLPVTKILYAMRGTDDVKEIVEKVDLIKKQLPEFKVFTIVSNTKYGAMVDGVKMARGNFMKELRETDKALIFHYDILSEGIDVDGITGVAILRNMQYAKLLQTIGRAVRLYKANPAAKPQAWVTVVAMNGNDENSQHVANVVTCIRDGGFEVNAEEVVCTDADGAGIPEDDDLEDIIEMGKKSKSMGVLENVLHDIEESEYWESRATNQSDNLIEAFA